MTPNQLLSGQILALDWALMRAKESLAEPAGVVGSALLKRVHGRFENDLTGLHDRCQSLLDSIGRGGAVETGWGKLGMLQQEAAEVMRECLAFVEGTRVREAGLDGGMCTLADSMLYDLSESTDMGWQRFTLIAPAEFYSTLSGIVRLRFTDTDIWNLPVAAHEFGHFVSGTPKFAEFGTLANTEKGNDPRYESHLRELFSDLFAIYALGPSFLLNCALLRFSPAAANRQSTTHPSNAQRIWWMLEA